MKFNRAFIMDVTDETAFLATDAFDHVKLKIIDITFHTEARAVS